MTMSANRYAPIVALAVFTASWACGGPSAEEGKILDVKLAHGIDEDMQAIDPGNEFAPDDTIFLTVTVAGRPRAGVYSARFYWKEDLIVESALDLAAEDVKSLSILGGNTSLGYTITHDQPFPISPHYRAEVLRDGEIQGTYPFAVTPPADAIPSKVGEVALALGADESYQPISPTNTFLPTDTVYLVGRADLGLSSWLQAEWHVEGEVDPDGTKEVTLPENGPDVPFTFSFIPSGGWPEGEHEVALRLNDVEVGRYSFTIRPDAEAGGRILYQDDFSEPGSGWDVTTEEGYTLGYDSGGYAITITQPNLTVWSPARQDFNDVRIEVDATKLTGPEDNYFGLLCRMTGSNLYILFVGSDGMYGIYKIREGEFRQLTTGVVEEGGPILPGDSKNHLAAECVGDKLALYANEEWVAGATDDEFKSGDVGLLAATFDEQGVRILFDDFVVYKP
jgi:hypothetical protein